MDEQLAKEVKLMQEENMKMLNMCVVYRWFKYIKFSY